MNIVAVAGADLTPCETQCSITFASVSLSILDVFSHRGKQGAERWLGVKELVHGCCYFEAT